MAKQICLGSPECACPHCNPVREEIEPRFKGLPRARTFHSLEVLMFATGKGRVEIDTIMRALLPKEKKSWDWYMLPYQMDKILTRLGVKYDKKDCTRATRRLENLKSVCDDLQYVRKPIILYMRGHYLFFFDGKVYDHCFPQGVTPGAHHWAKSGIKMVWTLRDNIMFGTLNMDFQEPEPEKTKVSRDVQTERKAHAEKMLAHWAAEEAKATKLKKKWARRVKYYERVMHERANPKPRVRVRKRMSLD